MVPISGTSLPPSLPPGTQVLSFLPSQSSLPALRAPNGSLVLTLPGTGAFLLVIKPHKHLHIQFSQYFMKKANYFFHIFYGRKNWLW